MSRTLRIAITAFLGLSASIRAQSAIPEWVDACDVHEPKVRKLFASECALIRKEALGRAKDGSYFLVADAFTYVRGGNPVDDAYCPSAPFYGQPRAAGAFPGRSGLLVGDDLVLTAAHTITGDQDLACLTLFYFVFDYSHASGPGGTCVPPAIERIPAENVYECSRIVRNGLLEDGGLDFLLVQLDRPVSGNRPPLRVRRSGAPSIGDRVVFLAHPDQLPAKASLHGAFTRQAPGAQPGLTSGGPLYFSGVHGLIGSSGGMFYNLDRELVETVLTFTPCPALVRTPAGCFTYDATTCVDAFGSPIVPFAVNVPLGEELLVTPLDTVVHDGPVGGPVTNPMSTYTLSVPSSATRPISFEITDPLAGAATLVDPPVLTATPSLEYTLALPGGREKRILFPGESATLTTLAGAGAMQAGTQTLRLVVETDASPFHDDVLHRFELGFTEFEVTPTVGFRAGGVTPPYTQHQTYTVRNVRSLPVAVGVISDSPWIALDADALAGERAKGQLSFVLAPAGSPGDSHAVSIAVDSSADSLPTGMYTGEVEFRNLSTQGLLLGTTTRSVTLRITRGDYRSLRFDIPDGDPEGVLIPIEVTQALDVCDLDFAMTSTVPAGGDGARTLDGSQLQVTLISPSGTRVVLWDHHAGSFNLVIFDDEGTPPPTGEHLSAFDGQPALGTWFVHAIDDVPGVPQALNALISIEPPRPTCPH